jgi:hypothetical protein
LCLWALKLLICLKKELFCQGMRIFGLVFAFHKMIPGGSYTFPFPVGRRILFLLLYWQNNLPAMLKQTRLLAFVCLFYTTAGAVAQTLRPVPALVRSQRPENSGISAHSLFRKTATLDGSAARFAQEAQFLRLDRAALDHLMATEPSMLTLRLPYHDTELVIDLVRYDITAPDFHIYADNRNETIDCHEGLHYRGMMRGATNSVAAISLFENEIFGTVSDALYHNLVLGRVQIAHNTDGYILYSERELSMDNPFECVLNESLAAPALEDLQQRFSTSKPAPTLHMALYAEHAFFLNRGDVTTTAHYLLAMFNQVAVLFANEGLQLELTRVCIQTSPVFDHTAGATGILEQFRMSLREPAADLTQLVGLAETNPESMACLDGLCTPQRAVAFCAIDPDFSNVPTFSWAAAALAHETGHLLGARHPASSCRETVSFNPCLPGIAARNNQDQAIENTLMRYCLLASEPVAFYAGFGPVSRPLMLDRVRGAACLQQTSGLELVPGERTGAVAGPLTITPNPARDRVNVHLAVEEGRMATRIQVSDLLGRSIRTWELSGQLDLWLDLSALDKGIYLVQVFSQDTLLATRRLIRE